jgi:hypothetical protein
VVNVNNGNDYVPKNKLRPIFLFGLRISPAMKVTLFHASLLKIEPTMAAAIAPNAIAVVYEETEPSFANHEGPGVFPVHVPNLTIRNDETKNNQAKET